MDYLLVFLEGIVSFVSPCLLPMVPIYISYFMGEDDKKHKGIINAIGFVIGFTTVFLILSIIASKFGIVISRYIKYIKWIFGFLIIILGFNYIGILKLNFLNKSKGIKFDFKNFGFIKAIIFGILFSISWTPCIGTFLASALMLISTSEDVFKGIILMTIYSVGLGIPFIISAILIEKLKGLFNFIKKNYNIVKALSGIILLIMGIYILFF